MGRVLTAYRNHPRHLTLFGKALNQKTLGRWLRLTQAQISKIEHSSRPETRLDVLINWAEILQLPSDMLWFDLPNQSRFASNQRSGQEGVHSDPAADDEAFVRLAAAAARPARADASTVAHLADVLAHQRQLEDVVGAARVLPAVLAEVELIESLAGDARGPVRPALIGLAGEYRQFAGWMGEDSGDLAAALAHYDRAAEAALETGDQNMLTSVLSLKSHLAWSRRDAGRAVGLAAAGQRDERRVSPGVRALIVQQEARGHGLDGDGDAVDRLMDRTEALTATAAEHPEDEPPWIYFNSPERVLFQRGVAYVELGRHAAAADLFDAARARLPPGYRRDHGRYAANVAVAAALDGQLDRASAAAVAALGIVMETGSAHTIADLRRARRALDRWADDPAVAEFDAALMAEGAWRR